MADSSYNLCPHPPWQDLEARAVAEHKAQVEAAAAQLQGAANEAAGLKATIRMLEQQAVLMGQQHQQEVLCHHPRQSLHACMS